jgi:guanine deaminase
MVASLCTTDSPSTQVSNTQFAGKQLSIPTLFYMATMGGASLCCLEDKIGSFAPKKAFDALLVSVKPDIDIPSLWAMSDPEFDKLDVEAKLHRRLEKFLFGGDDRNILKVYVQGACIGGQLFHL